MCCPGVQQEKFLGICDFFSEHILSTLLVQNLHLLSCFKQEFIAGFVKISSQGGWDSAANIPRRVCLGQGCNQGDHGAKTTTALLAATLEILK